MSFSRAYSAQTNLLSVIPISVETDISRGLNAFNIVGLADKAVEEARDRVSAAIKNSGFDSPKAKNHKIIISLAPADQKKEGTAFDVAIALSYLAANKDIIFDPENKLFLGELSLDGKTRPVRGILPVARFAKQNGFKELYVPMDNVREAAIIDGIDIFGVSSLTDLIEHLSPRRGSGQASSKKIEKAELTIVDDIKSFSNIDFSDIRGQERAKRGLLIAAAGGHNSAMYGPPGTGKTMLAKAFAGILPKLTFEEALEATSIHSVAGTLLETFITNPPFRAPHHTASYVSLVGGGATPKPGEITLAHCGVLFMDEFPEFERRVIESLRQPLEDKVISISRAKGTALFPANVSLIAAMNPCPCGNYGFRGKPCVCTPSTLARYRRKMSGPIMDRIDIWLEVDRVLPSDLSGVSEGEKSEIFRAKVESAREMQKNRFNKSGKKILRNSEMSARDMVTLITLDKESRKTLDLAAERLGFSPRVYHRMMKVARTIADLEGNEEIKNTHILEAVEYRPKKFDV
ncbi:MAG: magnesium chelatase [Candidatus Zambryskibacteria bacterium CG11_big_fil_rev_8_21_14_0_20_42_18]|uniref:Magnesium chelatase n=1 Tax=Candidatus Zambryskibacteria bacterium CG_4_9_14_3_um_filter_42_15 TaxID=1975112 RepID=A0A2M7WRK1_9BACT|nr:MAG: magnesium chelatase [Candidatus Zambryskibacteria bacterium CG11_big_fil_rev_8_21_14_0_20_42_18]PJA32631.1 MAG: magnesium chelatase [Candidatus Zambryskibacteria bacterium CG_4_9_14_3_um_filter_42_15]